MRHNFSLILLGLMALTGCGGAHNPQIPQLQNLEPLKESRSIEAYKGKVRLDPDSPEGLVVVLTARGSTAGSCTGVMVSESLVLTHSSCVDTHGSYSQCSKDIGVAIKTFSGNEWRTCKKLLSRTDSGPVLIELNAPVSDVRIHSISRQGISSSDEISVQAYDSLSTSGREIRTSFKTARCNPHNVKVTADIPKERIDIIPLFEETGSMSSCTISTGNTGAPIKNKRGEVVGLAIEASTKELELPYSPYLQSTKLSNIALAENLSCANFNYDLFDRDRSLECDEILEAGAQGRREAVRISGEALVDYIEQEAQLLINTLPQSFKYELKIDETSSERPVTFVPTCMLPLSDWSSEELSKLDRRGFFGRRKYYSTILPKFGFSRAFVIDEDMNLSFSPKIEQKGSVDVFSYNINGILNGATGEITVRSTFDTNLSLKLCL